MSGFYNYDTRGVSQAGQIVNLERMVEERDAEIDRLRAEVAKLREALRRVAIVGYELGVGTWCRCCHEWWLSAAPEKHKPGCLAAQEGEQ